MTLELAWWQALGLVAVLVAAAMTARDRDFYVWVLGRPRLHDAPTQAAPDLVRWAVAAAAWPAVLAFGTDPSRVPAAAVGAAAYLLLTAEALRLRHRLDLLQRRPERAEPDTFRNRNRKEKP